MVIVTIAVVSWYKIIWVLYGFVIAIPLISGLQLIGFLHYLPPLMLGFASIYLSWLPRRLFCLKEGITPRTEIGGLVDIVSGIVLLSLIMIFWFYPKDIVLNHLWFGPLVTQENYFYCINGAQVLLQGLFFYRIIDLEVVDKKEWKRVILILFFQASIIIFFSSFQLVSTIVKHKLPYKVHFPFNDIHSYGSYVALLFFCFLCFSFYKNAKIRSVSIIFALFFFVFIILSFSRATWIATFIVSLSLLILRYSIKKIVIFACCILVLIAWVNLFHNDIVKSKNRYLRRLGRVIIINNYKKDATILGRLVRWKTPLGIIKEYPITGSGIGTYYNLSSSYVKAEDKLWIHKINRRWKAQENAHNYYLQFGSDLGIPALLIFLSIIYYTYKAGFRVLSKDRDSMSLIGGLLLGLSAYLITMLTGHPLLLSNQQFLFWFIIAAITIRYNVSGNRTIMNGFKRHSKVLVGALAIIMVVGYTFEIYGNHSLPMNYEYGFYGYEDWNGDKMRWTMKESSTLVSATSDLFGLKLIASAYNSKEPNGLKVKIYINEQILDEINIINGGARSLYYYVPFITDSEVYIKIKVNPIFNPYRLGLSRDNRDLGVAVSPIKFIEKIPEKGIGFYEIETYSGEQPPVFLHGQPLKYRWTGMRASMEMPRELLDKGTLLLMSAHPNIDKEPVVVKILGDDMVIWNGTFTNNLWKKVILQSDKIKDLKVLTFQVNRTWNPKLTRVSGDSRDLGVAVAILNKSVLRR